MREINFRGKSVMSIEELDKLQIGHKEGWVIGSLITNGGSLFIVGDIADQGDEYIQPEWWVAVDPETVGQFTGLLDKNGVGIYEGHDVKRTHASGSVFVGKVVFEDATYFMRNEEGYAFLFPELLEVQP